MNTEVKAPKLPPIIGLTGAAGAGKDSVAIILASRHGALRLSVAEPIRAMLAALLDHLDISRDYLTERELKETNIPGIGSSYRQLAQTLGTEWGRQQIPGLWINMARTLMDNIDADNRRAGFDPRMWVISDVRFPDEAEFVRQRGGVIWRVVRPGLEPVRPHISEAGAHTIEPDARLINDSTVEHLAQRVAALLQQTAA